MSDIDQMLDRQSRRVAALNTGVVRVQHLFLGTEVFDSPVDPIYELSQVSATRSYIHFSTEVIGESIFGPVVGSWCQDWAVNETARCGGRIVVSRHSGEILLMTHKGSSELIASKASVFQEIYDAFVELRSVVCLFEYDEHDSGFCTADGTQQYLESTRTFWLEVADRDPSILNSGSSFWSQVLRDSPLWRD